MAPAQDLDIDGRSSMNKDKLLEAIDEGTDDNGRGKGSVAALENMTRDALYGMAQERDIDGRSKMSKDELVEALTKT